MKKLCVLMFVATTVALYAGGTVESQTSVGMQYANLSESQLIANVDVTATLHSAGVFFTNNTFYNNNEKQGIFVIDSFLMPIGGTLSASGESMSVSFKNTDLRVLIGLIIGPVYRFKLNNETSILLGIGPSVQELVVTSPYSSSLTILMGAGADICVQNRISDSSFLSLGVTLEYDFAAWSRTNSIERWSDAGYSSFSIRPYLGIGFSKKTRTSRIE